MRTSFVRLPAIAALAVLALAACGSSSKKSTATTGTTATPAATVPAESTTTGGSSYSQTTTGGSSSQATATVALAAVKNEGVGTTKVLVDANGKTLYVWDNDKTAGKADCTGACAEAWPPLYVTGTPTYGTGVDASLFSTVMGPNGQKQLAVNGKPLYLWAGDAKVGDATGQGVNHFYVVAADGKKIDKD
jgi:predicted lipoprotein with Yx(FWY)xxD motif